MESQTIQLSGFESMLAKRAGMSTSSLVKTLVLYASNREAAAIVESFRRQIDFEESAIRANAA